MNDLDRAKLPRPNALRERTIASARYDPFSEDKQAYEPFIFVCFLSFDFCGLASKTSKYLTVAEARSEIRA